MYNMVIVEKVRPQFGVYQPHLYAYYANERLAFDAMSDFNKDKDFLASIAQWETLRDVYYYAWSQARGWTNVVHCDLENGYSVYHDSLSFWAVVYGFERILGKGFTERCKAMYEERTGLKAL